jgi:SAM-dependent methyltransferase
MSHHLNQEGEQENMPRALPMERTSAAESFPQDAARPLGKGYSEIMQMVLSYAVAGKSAGNPTLSHSLERIRLMPDLKQHLAGLAKDPLCLIQGYSTPGNAEALKQFIHDINQSLPRIETVDLYDLPHLYEVLDLKMPCMRYHIADASHLDHLYHDGAVDLVVQDFLLNCIPASRHEPLLKEVGRLLKPGGLGIISFTSSEALELSSAMSTAQLQTDHHLTWDSHAYDLAGMEKANGSASALDHLTGKLIYHQATSEYIYIAALGGRFEFFRSKEEMLSLFEKCGLHLLCFDLSQGSDDHGLSCIRYRCILIKQSSPQS